MYEQGDLVVVPFPFTDLSSLKKRPAIVVSPNWFNDTEDDVVLVAVTSSVPEFIDENLEVFLSEEDMFSGTLARESIARVSKMFTCDKGIVDRKVGAIKATKLDEILEKMRLFFANLG